MTEKRNDWARVGVVIGSRGLKGEVLIKSFTAQPENIGVYGQVFDNVDRYFDIKVIGKKNKLVIACLSGVLNRKDADALKGVSLYVLKKMLPTPGKEEFLSADLLELNAETIEGKVLGKVQNILNFGAGDIIEISDGTMIPFTIKTVPVVDLANNKVIIDQPVYLVASEQKKNDSNDV